MGQGGWWRGAWACAASVTLLLGLLGCRSQEDAVAAAQQTSETTAAMQQYYAALDVVAVKTVEVRRAQRQLLHGPPDPASDDRLALRQAELAKRAVLAGDVAKLAELFADITDSDAATRAAKSAEDLRKQVVGLNLITDNGTVKIALEAAVTSLVNAVRAHDEVKAAKALDPVLVALCRFFDSEKQVYEAVTADFYTGAAANALELIDEDQVSVSSQYRSSLAPFGLRAEISKPELRAAARDDLKSSVNSRVAALNQGSTEATEALGRCTACRRAWTRSQGEERCGCEYLR